MFDEEICIILICYEFKKKIHSTDYGIAISLAQRPKVILQSRKLHRRAVSYTAEPKVTIDNKRNYASLSIITAI